MNCTTQGRRSLAFDIRIMFGPLRAVHRRGQCSIIRRTNVVDHVAVQLDALFVEEFVELGPVVQLALKRLAIVVRVHLHILRVVSRKDLSHKKAVGKVTLHILYRV